MKAQTRGEVEKLSKSGDRTRGYLRGYKEKVFCGKGGEVLDALSLETFKVRLCQTLNNLI